MAEGETEENPSANETVASAVGEFFCELCRLEFSTKLEFEEHSWTILHHGKLNKSKGRDCVHECSLCQEQFCDLLSFTSHLHSDTHQEKYNTWKKQQKASVPRQYTEELRPRSPAGFDNRKPFNTRGTRSRPPRRSHHHRNSSRGSPQNWRGRHDNVRSPHGIVSPGRDFERSPGRQPQWFDNRRGRGMQEQHRHTRWDFSGEGFQFDFPNPINYNKYRWIRPAIENSNNQNLGYESEEFGFSSNERIPNPSMEVPGQLYGYNKTFEPGYNKIFEPPSYTNYQPRRFQPYQEYGDPRSFDSNLKNKRTDSAAANIGRQTIKNSGKTSSTESLVHSTSSVGSSLTSSSIGISTHGHDHNQVNLDVSDTNKKGTPKESELQEKNGEQVDVQGIMQSSLMFTGDDSTGNREETLRSQLGIKKEPKDTSEEFSIASYCNVSVKQEPGLENQTEVSESRRSTYDPITSSASSSSQCSFFHIDGVRCTALTSERFCSYHNLRFQHIQTSTSDLTEPKNISSERSCSAPLAVKSTGLVNLNDTLQFRPARVGGILNRDAIRTQSSFRRASTQSEGGEPYSENTSTSKQMTALGMFLKHRGELEIQDRDHSSTNHDTPCGESAKGAPVNDQEVSDDVKMIDLSFSTKYLAQPQSIVLSDVAESRKHFTSNTKITTGLSSEKTEYVRDSSITRKTNTGVPYQGNDMRPESTSQGLNTKLADTLAFEPLESKWTKPSDPQSDPPHTNPIQPVSPCPSPPLFHTSPISPSSSTNTGLSALPTNATGIRSVDFSRLNLPPHIRRALALKYSTKKQSDAVAPSVTIAPNLANSRTRVEEGKGPQVEQRRHLSTQEHPKEPSISLLPPLPRINRSSSLDSYQFRLNASGEMLISEMTKSTAVSSSMDSEPVNMISVASGLGRSSLALRRHSRSDVDLVRPVEVSGSDIGLPKRMIDLSTAPYLSSIAVAPETTNSSEVWNIQRKEDAEMEMSQQPSHVLARSDISSSLDDVPTTVTTSTVLSFSRPQTEPASTAVTYSSNSRTNILQQHGLLDLGSSSSRFTDGRNREPHMEDASRSDTLLKHGLVDLDTVTLPAMRTRESEVMNRDLYSPKRLIEDKVSSSLDEKTKLDSDKQAPDATVAESDVISRDLYGPKRQLEDKFASRVNKKKKLDSDRQAVDAPVSYTSGVNIQQLLKLEYDEQVQLKALERTQGRIRDVRDKIQTLTEELERLHSQEKNTASNISELKSKRLHILHSALQSGTSRVPQSSKAELDSVITVNNGRPDKGTSFHSEETKQNDSSPISIGHARISHTDDSNNVLEAHRGPSEVVHTEEDASTIVDDVPTRGVDDINHYEQQDVVFDETVIKIEVPDEETAAEIAALGPVLSISNHADDGTLTLETGYVSQDVPISMETVDPEPSAPINEQNLRRSPRRPPEVQQSSDFNRRARKAIQVPEISRTKPVSMVSRASVLSPSKGGASGSKDTDKLSRNHKDLMKKMRHLHSGAKPQLGKRKKDFTEAQVSNTLALSRERIQSVRERMKLWKADQDVVMSTSETTAQMSASTDGVCSSETESVCSTINTESVCSTINTESVCSTTQNSASGTTSSSTTVFYKDTPLTPSQVPVRDTRHPARKTTKELKKSSLSKSKRKGPETPKEQRVQERKQARNKERNKRSAKRKKLRLSRREGLGDDLGRARSRTSTPTQAITKRDENSVKENAQLKDGRSKEIKEEAAAVQSEPTNATPVSLLQVPTAAVESLKRKLQRKTRVSQSSIPESVVFDGHTGAVCSIKVRQGRLFTCSADKSTKAFDVKTGECTKTYQGHHHAVNCLEISEDGSRLFTGSNDQTVRSYNVKTGSCTHKFTFHGRVMCLHAGFGLLYVGLNSGIVTCVNLKTNACVERLHCHDPRGISCLATATEGQRKLLCTGSFDATITIRDSTSGLLIRTIKSHTMTVLCMQVVENVVYSGAADYKVMAHDLNTGELLRRYSGHTLSVSGLQVVGRVLVTSCLDKLIRCYDLMSAELLQVYGGHKEMIFSVHMANGRIYSGARDGKVTSVKLDLRVYHPCKWKDCQMKFGINSHLKDHVTEVHVLQRQGGRCMWADCEHVFADQTNDTEANLNHVVSHVESRDSKV